MSTLFTTHPAVSYVIIILNKISESIYLSIYLSICSLSFCFFFNKVHVQVNQTRYDLTWVVRADQTMVMSQPKIGCCVEVLRPSQPNGVMSSAVSLPNHTFTGQA